MKLLDQCVDALESAIAERGVAAVDVREFAPQSSEISNDERGDIVIELLRVWMEHQWNSGNSITTAECLRLFPSIRFQPTQIDELQSEETRQAAIAGAWSSTGEIDQELLTQLPSVGDVWLDFELVTELGRGASAVVFLAKQRDLAHRWVALKLTNRKSFESHWLASLQHSAIVPIYSTHHQEGVYGICMPYLGNTTLADILAIHRERLTHRKTSRWFQSKAEQATIPLSVDSTVIRRHARISTFIESPTTHGSTSNDLQTHSDFADTAASNSSERSSQPSSASTDLIVGNSSSYVEHITRIAFQIAQALKYAHQLGIIHSDIKPANVLLGHDGQARLLDFNVAYTSRGYQQTTPGIASPQSSTLPVGGTYAYMAPELRQELTGKTTDTATSVDGRSDIYSFGMLFYELLHGRLPSKKQAAPLPTQLQWNADVSPALQAIIGKCIAAEPAARYSSASHLADDLQAHCESRPLVHQPEPSFGERVHKWSRRHPRLSSSLSVSLFAASILAMLLGIGWRQYQHAQQLEWTNRLQQLTQALPETMSLVSALKLAPELNDDAADKVNHLLDTISVKDDRTNTRIWDARWKSESPTHQAAHAQVQALLYLADKQDWKNAPALPPHDPKLLDPQEISRFAMMESGNYANAIQEFEAALEKNPHDFHAWWMLGDCYLASRDFRQADQAYSICIALQPQIAVAYFLRGNARMGEERYSLAAEDYHRASELRSKWPQSHFNRAVCLHNLEKHAEALLEIALAQSAGMNSVSLYRLEGEAYLALNDAEKSSHAFQTALKLEPLGEQDAIDRGLLWLDIDPKRAEADFLTALKFNAKSAEARQKLAYVYSELMGDADRSLVQLNDLIQLQPDQPTHHAGKAVLLARNQRRDEAEQELKTLDAMTITEGIVAYQIACAHSLLASNDSNDRNFHKNRAFFWLVQATSTDPTLVPIIMSDPDSTWLREQPEFKQWFEAIKIVHPHLFATTATESSP